MEIRLLPDAEVRSRSHEIWVLYQEVFADRPDYAVWLETTLLRHAARSGFRLAGAFENGQIVGFAWGYEGAVGQYYIDSVLAALDTAVAREWVPAFIVSELAVSPAMRRRGVGRSLLRLVMAGVRGPALLSTWDDRSDPAVRLYLAEGWEKIGSHANADGTHVMQIMGRRPSALEP